MSKKSRETFMEYFVYGGLSAIGVLLLIWTATLMWKYFYVAN